NTVRSPSYQIRSYDEKEQAHTLELNVSKDGRKNSIKIYQDVDIFAGKLGEGTHYSHVLKSGRGAWIQVISGRVNVNNSIDLSQGDGLGIQNEELELKAREEAELLLFDMAMDFKTPYKPDYLSLRIE